MKKEAKTAVEIHPLLKKRWSPRAFSDKLIDAATIRSLFEAARWAPSSMNEQPWRFIIGLKGDDTYRSIFEALVEFNRLWAGFAPVLAVSCGKTAFSGKNDGKPNESFAYDVGQSVAHLTFQAMHEGLYVHQMGGFDKKMVIENFSIPEGFVPLTVFAIGYLGEPEMLHPNLIASEKGERVRMERSSFLYSEKFGKTGDMF